MKNVFINFVLLFSLSGSLPAAEIRVAVASNFKYTLLKLAADFKVKTDHDLVVSSASSGKLFAQIVHGAPYDVFLSADEKRADLLIAEKIASADSAYVYALGKLVLISNIESGHDCKEVLISHHLRRLAIANPKIAPYGLAAKQVLDKLGFWQQLQSRLVMGENISQTFQFVYTKNADAGFVARSILNMPMINTGGEIEHACLWNVPVELYSPIKQKLAVLNKVKNKRATQAFVQYLKSDSAREIILTTGYDVL